MFSSSVRAGISINCLWHKADFYQTSALATEQVHDYSNLSLQCKGPFSGTEPM